ncbi:MAG TPA: AzlC family ABC transporter permease [Acidimicrobiia bacterium]|nr:AzlC family ABC transporter permease [Acidimicrobiia bacterium]
MSPSFRRGLRDTVPLLPPLAVFGAVFGALAVQAGLSPWLTMLSSLIVLSGSAQVAMAGLLASGAAPVLLATTGLALRHLPMSAALSGLIGNAPIHRRVQLAWVLVDETFGLTVNAARDPSVDLVSFKSAADLVLYITWLLSTAVGAFLGADVDTSLLGIEVIFPLVFLGLAAPLLRNRRQWMTAGLAVLTAVAAVLVLPSEWRVTAAAVVAALIGSRIR